MVIKRVPYALILLPHPTICVHWVAPITSAEVRRSVICSTCRRCIASVMCFWGVIGWVWVRWYVNAHLLITYYSDCWNQYLSLAIKENKPAINCPGRVEGGGTCKLILEDSVLLKMLQSEEDKQRYKDTIVKSFVECQESLKVHLFLFIVWRHCWAYFQVVSCSWMQLCHLR